MKYKASNLLTVIVKAVSLQRTKIIHSKNLVTSIDLFDQQLNRAQKNMRRKEP